MRLWHKDLIPVLPDKQLIGQWRECCCIAKNLVEKGTPNHILVNKVLDYPLDHFYAYCNLIGWEAKRRGFKIEWECCMKWLFKLHPHFKPVDEIKLFTGWHNDRYLVQCMCNLQEKYDCGGITEYEYQKLLHEWSELEGNEI